MSTPSIPSEHKSVIDAIQNLYDLLLTHANPSDRERLINASLLTLDMVSRIATRPLVIAFAARKYSGKTTAALFFQGLFEIFNFADPLKEFAIISGFQHHEVYGTEAQKQTVSELMGVSGRTFLQRMGTDIVRNHIHLCPGLKLQGLNYWSFVTRNRVIGSKKHLVMLADLRFEDEKRMVDQLHGYTIKITRNIDRSGPEHQHASETGIDDMVTNYTVSNDSTLDDFKNKLHSIIVDVYIKYMKSLSE